MLLLIKKHVYFLSLLVCITLAAKMRSNIREKVFASTYPYIVFIQFDKISFRGSGIILNKRFILTTGRSVCEVKTKLTILRVFLGNGNKIEIESMKCHENYTQQAGDADLAILKTKSEISADFVANKFVKLASKNFRLKEGSSGQVVTWRDYPNKFNKSIKALEVSFVDIFINSTCSSKFGEYDLTKYLCVAPKSPRYSCREFNGGPVVFKGTVIAVIIIDKSYCYFNLTRPKIAIMVSSYLDWINKNSNYENMTSRIGELTSKASSFRALVLFKTVAFCFILGLFGQ